MVQIKNYLLDAAQKEYKTIVTFGVLIQTISLQTAWAAKEPGLIP